MYGTSLWPCVETCAIYFLDREGLCIFRCYLDPEHCAILVVGVVAYLPCEPRDIDSDVERTLIPAHYDRAVALP
jgi:hypothetical protein